jgi:UDP-glucose 4-epimerase
MILVTGGAGYIGSHVNKGLHVQGHDTLVFDNLTYGHRELAKWGTFVQGDLEDKDHLREVFRRYPITAVMHFAAFAYVGESVENPRKYYINNVCNALNLLDVMLEYNVELFIFSSTCATYGTPVRIPIGEDHPQDPINPYGRSKLMVENILKDYSAAYGLRYVSLRYFNAAGADPDNEVGEWHEPETHLIPLVLDAASGRREDVRIFGTDYPTPDGTCMRDYIHVTDLSDAHLLALDYLAKGGESQVFNLGNGNGFSVKEVIECAQKVTGRPIRWVESDRRAGDPPVLVGSSERARTMLNWTPHLHELRAILETAWAWHRRRTSP